MPTRLLQDVVTERLRARRLELGLSQEELSQRVAALGPPWTRATTAKVEGGHRPVGLEELLALSAALAVPLGELLRHDGLVLLHPTGLALDGRALVAALQHGLPAWPAETVEAMAQWRVDFREDDAVRHAAKKLGKEPGEVAAAARVLYHRPLSDERDARVTAQLGADATRESVRAHRGHAMRALIADLREDFEVRQANLEALWADAVRRHEAEQ